MAEQHLPLPGEKPPGVWRPRRRKAPHPWFHTHSSLPWRLLPWVAAALIVLAGIKVWQATAVPVTVVVNGEPIALNTHRTTVAGVVRAAGVRLNDAVYLVPPADTPITANLVVTVASLRPAIVHVDGQTVIGPSRTNDARRIVEGMGIVLGPHDAVRVERAMRPSPAEIAANPALANVPALPREITVVRPSTVIVNEGESRVAFETTAPSLGQALSAAGYALYEADKLSPPPDTPIIPGTTLEAALARATPVTVCADGVTYVVRTHQPTVGQLLNELGLALIGGDYVLPGIDAPVGAAGIVRLVRVSEEAVTEEEPIPFGTVYMPDPDLELDQQRVIEAGREGVLVRQVQVRYEDGLEVSRAVKAEWVARQPQAQVVAYGTRIVLRRLETRYGTFQYWRKLRVLATSYSPSTAGWGQPGDPGFGLTATGDPVERGVIAVDPRLIGLYTWLYVPGYGPGRALDVGGAIRGLRIDLGYSDDDLVLWNEWVDVYLLTPVPPPDRMIWVLPQAEAGPSS